MVKTSGENHSRPFYIMPVMESELYDFKYYPYFYILYIAPNGEIKVAMPFVENEKINNMQEAVSASLSSYFYNGCHNLKAQKDNVTDRPVYEVSLNKEREIISAKVINGVDVPIEFVIQGKFINGASRIKRMKEPSKS